MRPQSRLFTSGRAAVAHLVRTRSGRSSLLGFLELPVLELEAAAPSDPWEAAADLARLDELEGALSPVLEDPALRARAGRLGDRMSALRLRLESVPGAARLVAVVDVMSA